MIAKLRPSGADATQFVMPTPFIQSSATSLDRFAMQLQPDDRYEVLQIGDQLILVEVELAAYIRAEAAARGASVASIYDEEMEARRELALINPSLEEWLALSRGSGAPEYMKGEQGGPCPF